MIKPKVDDTTHISSLLDGVVADKTSIEINAQLVRENFVRHELLRLAESIPTMMDGPAQESLSKIDTKLSKLRRIVDETATTQRLRSLSVDPKSLVDDLERLFAHHAWLPAGAALTLALWVMNTAIFDVFDSTPYLLLESAVPGCGKTTVLDLLNELCRPVLKTSSASEAALFRVIEAEHPVLILDESDVFCEKSERATAILSILNSGYKRGGKALRCVGDFHEPRLFDTYCPKALACLSNHLPPPATLDRCIIFTMGKAPATFPMASSRIQHLPEGRVTSPAEMWSIRLAVQR